MDVQYTDMGHIYIPRYIRVDVHWRWRLENSPYIYPVRLVCLVIPGLESGIGQADVDES